MKKERKSRKEEGITLVALIITIIILIILAAVTILTLTNENMIGAAAEGAEKYQEEQFKEAEEINKLTDKLNEAIKGIEDANNGNTKESISRKTGYVGCYADLDPTDGKIDGIIYADLAVGNTGDGEWTNSYGKYTIPVVENVKDYYISQKSYKWKEFEEKPVISQVKTSTGEDRFYIMALEDVELAHPYSSTVNEAYWYYNASIDDKMSDYAEYTSLDFEKGKENTKKMIARWNKDNTEVINANDVDYGAKNETDMWGQIDEEVAKGWFVPSKEEWAAFGGEIGEVQGITNSNYKINFRS